MDESTSKEKVLKKIRNALITKTDKPYPDIDNDSSVYLDISNDELDIRFAEEFSKVSGKFIYNENHQELVNNLKILCKENNWTTIFCLENKIKELLTAGGIEYTDQDNDLAEIQVGLTFCEFLIARLGSVMVSAKQASGRRLPAYSPVHIVIAYSSQLVPDIKQALSGMKEKYGNKLPSLISLLTGPSRTADIEKTLVVGVHGPKEIYVLLVDDSIQKI